MGSRMWPWPLCLLRSSGCSAAGRHAAAPYALLGFFFALAPMAHAFDFGAAVESTHPIAFYRLNGSESALQALGAVQFHGGAQLNGKDAYIVTPQKGGIQQTATLMAWVNFASLPSDKGHIYYIAGESQGGNDFDLQLETNNKLRFFTGGGGSLDFTPPAASLVGQWHMIVAVMDSVHQNLSIFWDGKPAATLHMGSSPVKSSQLSIGESLVFRGRYFDGSIRDVALWNRLLDTSEVARLWSAATAVSKTQAGGTTSGKGLTTTATVEVKDHNGKVALKQEENIAIMFLSAFQSIETDCKVMMQRFCGMDEVLPRLKYNPTSDPNYRYTLKASAGAWEARATGTRDGLRGFYYITTVMSPDAFYSDSGEASVADKQLLERSIIGEQFNTR